MVPELYLPIPNYLLNLYLPCSAISTCFLHQYNCWVPLETWFLLRSGGISQRELHHRHDHTRYCLFQSSLRTLNVPSLPFWSPAIYTWGFCFWACSWSWTYCNYWACLIYFIFFLTWVFYCVLLSLGHGSVTGATSEAAGAPWLLEKLGRQRL